MANVFLNSFQKIFHCYTEKDLAEVIFSGLIAHTTYFAYARSKENDDYFAGAASVSKEIITDGQDIPLKAYIRGGKLTVRGLMGGKVWSIYDTSGNLVYRNIASSDEESVLLNAQGVFIVESEGRTVKVAYYGQ